MKYSSYFERPGENHHYHAPQCQSIAGYTLGIIVLDLCSPKIPGMVASAASYGFPVRHKLVNINPPHLVLHGSPEALDELIKTGRELQEEGVRAIIGACGYFGHYQQQLTEALDIPVYLSSLLQFPIIKSGLKCAQKVGVLCADKTYMTEELLQKNGVDDFSRVVIEGMGEQPQFSAIMEPRPSFDNNLLKEEVVNRAVDFVKNNKGIGALLLECSDFPPYSADVQNAVQLPVFDFMTLINWVHRSVAQRPYYGFL